MKVKDLKAALADYPEDASVELSKLLALKPDGDEQDSGYEVLLDFPIIGIAYHEGDNDLRLIVSHGETLSAFGKVKPFAALESDTSA